MLLEPVLLEPVLLEPVLLEPVPLEPVPLEPVPLELAEMLAPLSSESGVEPGLSADFAVSAALELAALVLAEVAHGRTETLVAV